MNFLGLNKLLNLLFNISYMKHQIWSDLLLNISQFLNLSINANIAGHSLKHQNLTNLDGLLI